MAVHGIGSAREVEFAYTVERPNGLERTDDTFSLRADQVLKAIGQKLEEIPYLVKTDGQKIRVSQNGRTSHRLIWAGGDCASGGDDLTVTAVAEGRNTAEDMHGTLMG